MELKETSAKLIEENKAQHNSVVHLNQTVTDLTELNTAMNLSVTNLNMIVEKLNGNNTGLELQVNHLLEEKGDLNEALQLYERENQHLNELNGNLTAITDSITRDTDQSYKEVVSYLAGIINEKRTLAQIGMKDRMQAQIAGLECAFLVAFGTNPFVQDTA